MIEKNQGRTTLEDIARMAGVSVSTVSRVINNGIVSEKTKKKVQKVLKEMNYFPNAIARSLRGGQTNTIGVIIPDITNPFFTQIITELGKLHRDSGYSIMVCNTFDDPTIEHNQIISLLEKRVDGLIVTSSDDSFAKIYEDINQSQPVILIDRVISSNLDSIRTDNVEGAMHATSYLLNKGYKNILTIAGPQNVTPGRERLSGYRRAMDLYNRSINDLLIQFGDFTKKSGYELCAKVLREHGHIDAVFAANNFMGVGAIEALKDHDLKIPEDVALIMFDDLDLADVVDPPITVVDQATREIGREAGNLIIRRIEDTERFEPQEILIKSKLIIRRSA